MHFLRVLVIVVVVVGAIAFPNVSKFEVKDNDRVKKPLRTQTFEFNDCGNGQTPWHFDTLSTSPDPIHTPGALYVNFEFAVNATLAAPMPADILLQKKVEGTWVNIPCIGHLIGTCHYDDLCVLMQQLADSVGGCPGPLPDSGFNCRCPIKIGKYTLPKSEFDIDSAAIAAGDYHMRANATYMGKPAVCIDFYISFSE